MSTIGSRPRQAGIAVLGLLTLSMILVFSPVLAAADGQVLLEKRIDSGQWAWEVSPAGGRYLAAEGYRTLNEMGQPRLPYQDLLLLIPADREVAEAWVEPLSVRREKDAAMPELASAHLTSTEETHPVARLERVDGAFPRAVG